MIREQCDSTTDEHIHDHSHSPGCVQRSNVCTDSLLELALTAGSAYAVRFTTCVIDTTSRVNHQEGKQKPSQQTAPYQKKKKCGINCVKIDRIPNSGSALDSILSDNSVTSSTEPSGNGDFARVESSAEGQRCGGFLIDTTEQTQVGQKSEPDERMSEALLKAINMLPDRSQT